MEDINSEPSVQDTRSPAPVLWLLGILTAFLLGVGAGYLLWARPLSANITQLQATNAALVAPPQAPEAQQNQPVQRYDVPVDDDPILGSSDAPITIIEFSDYECPFCRRWHQEVMPQIQAKYGDSVRFVYRDFPLYSIHPNAEPAAIAANCAGEQDQYWAFNELIFATDTPLSREVYEAHAQTLEMDLDAFRACIDSGRTKAEVDADYAYASQLGVRSTPTFFINGLAVVGAQPFEVFEQLIDMELAGQIP